MEWPEWGTYRTCVDPALEILKKLVDKHSRWEDERLTMLLEFRFFKMLFWGLDHWQASQEYHWHLRSIWTTMGCKFTQMVEQLPNPGDVSGGHFITCIEKRIKPFKQQAKVICILLLGTEISCEPCQQDPELFLEYGKETASFIEFLMENLEAFISRFHLIAPAKQRIDFITWKLKVIRRFVNPISDWTTRVKNLGELVSETRTWANHLSCLAYLYWIDHGMDETLASTMGTMISDLMHITMSSIPGVVTSYFKRTLIPQILARYFDFLLQELVLLRANDDIEILQEGIKFLLSFMTDPPEKYSKDRELILEKNYSIINDLLSLIYSIHSSEMKDRIPETKLYDFLQKIVGVEDEVRKLYAITPRSVQFNSPRTNAMGFLDSLLQKLEKWLEGEVNLTARVKHGIQTVWEELTLFRPFMQHVTNIQNEQKQKDLWTRIVDVVYYAAYVTNLCPCKSFSRWYGIVHLPNVIEEIKLIKNEVRKIKDPQMHTNKMFSVEMESKDTLLPRATTSLFEGAFIGFREDTESIIDHLIGGRKDLTIISISGMAGQGKTTLAKRIYNDPRIQHHFHKTVWRYVSKECKIRDLMIYTVHDVSKRDDAFSELKNQDLAEILRKSLKGRRYLIVMDDIWDDGVWCEVQSSFPDDRLGSRILFTSRNHNLKSQGERNFISYPLRPFSQEESWDLMKEKFNSLGTEFEVIGKKIAESCKGLPLAVALVASLLGKTKQKLELWYQVAENLKSCLASEGCMHIIELSFKYLPEHLKSCFLYFGAFPRGENICAKRLKLLWIAEGFIKENETRCSKDLAEECLDYLVSQSLVVVVERSSKGGIKTCNVHDLIYDLCLGKIAKDNFLHWIDWYTIGDECRSSSQKYAHHRLCIGGSDHFMEARPIYGRMELPTSPVHSLLWLGRLASIDGVNLLKSFKVLTVLDLEDVEMIGDVFPEVILHNIHLKYLALCEHFKDIPPSIAELWNLETLILKGNKYGMRRRIPDTMWKMKSLRHVRIDGGYVTSEYFEGNESYVASLDNIETLCGLFLGDAPRKTVEFLGRMTRLWKLKCSVLEYALFSWVGSLENLEEINFSSNFSYLVFETYSSVFLQNKNIRKLSLHGWRVSSWSVLSTIGKQMPNLEVLKLESVVCEESRRWDLKDGELSKLRYLKLSRLGGLEEINVSDGCDNPFPSLEVLFVEICWRLKEIPFEIGEGGYLNTIKMSGCSRKASESVKQISEQQQELGNYSLQVFVTDILYDDDEEEAEATEEEESN